MREKMDICFEEYNQDDYYEEKYADELEMMNELEELNGVQIEPPKLPKSQLKEHLENPLSTHEGLGVNKNGHVQNTNIDKRKREFDPDVDLYLSEEEDDTSVNGFAETTVKRGRYSDTAETNEKLSIKRVFSIPPLGKDVVTITGTQGRRVFLCQQRKESDDENAVTGKTCRLRMQLLSRPFKELKSQVEEMRRKEAIERAEALTMNLQGPIDEELSLDSEAREQDHGTDEKLWVEKYTPKSFQELLSDDGTNRTLLKWIKLWEPTVFGKESVGLKEKKVIKKDVVATGSKKGKFKKQWDHSDDLVLDASGRPKYKIALLCGNPGLGKTTLAHVIGNHAGYNIVEMNASDDRSPDIFRNKIEDATQMKALIGEDKRPNCLVIDEIDGAPGPAINLLVQAAKDSQSNSKEGKKRSKLALNRPIICICNNQYVPALKQLRQNSLILNFPRTAPAKLVQRLLEISKKEDMRVDMATLFSLCDQSEHDIRSCINTLQFVRRKHKVLRMEHLQTLDVGVKDMKCGLFDFVRQVFQLPKSNKQALKMRNFGGNGIGTNCSNQTLVKQSSAAVRFHHVLQLAYSVSENERMLQGIHDNYLLSRAKDPRLDSMVSAAEWLQFADTLNQMISSLQTFTLWKYFPFVPVAFHMMLSSPIGPRLNFQNSQIEFVMTKARINQTLGTVTQEVTPFVRKNLSEETAVTETMPYLFHIITPHLRPVNIQLYSDNEKSELRNLIEIMISYNLTYQQEKSLDGQYSYLLEPHIEELITYPGIPRHKHLTYALKQMIAREIELEKMRRIEKFRVAEATVARQTKKKAETNRSVVLSIEPKKLQKGKEKVTRDFFGRLVKPKPEETPRNSGQKKTTDSLVNTKVWFKFNEGFTNAVRRPVKVKELL